MIKENLKKNPSSPTTNLQEYQEEKKKKLENR